jgi:hypothetical protein
MEVGEAQPLRSLEKENPATSAPSCFRDGTRPLAAVFQSVALTPNVDGRRMVQQPVQDRRGDDRIAEDPHRLNQTSTSESLPSGIT